jgi:type VI secretion system secreted protein VgrG
VRVASTAAGNSFGNISIPRVGQEVVVDFEHGDPDLPIVTGRVYNPLNMPPWTLPAHQTQSGILTRSTEGGGTAHANALRFEDMKGKEEIWLHAERDLRSEVEHNESHSVGVNRSKSVGANESASVGEHRTHQVGKTETTTIGADRTETVGGKHTETITKDREINVTEGQSHTKVKGDVTIESTSAGIFMSAPQEIKLTVGRSSITIKDGTIDIIGPTKINLNP